MNRISLQTGATLRGGTYRIDRVLGQGGFGITYLATDLSLDKHVAIKEFFPKDFCDRDSSTSHVTLGTQSTSDFVGRLKAKFLKEAKNIAKFDHPNIIKIHAAFEENNTAYYVMDFIEGASLSDRVKRTGPLSRATALDYVVKIGGALDYVHSFHMNHLDVKPANIMVRNSDNCPMLIDFGLSKQYDSSGNQTSTTPVGISHGYAPMEQYNDGGVREFSPTTDEYSLAATLYYLLSGVTPPQATKLIEDDLTFPQSIPSDLIPSISKAMSSARKKRYPTVQQFIASLNTSTIPSEDPENTDFPEPKPTPKPTPKPKSNSQSKRTKWLTAGGVAIALIVINVWRSWHNPVPTTNGIDSLSVISNNAEKIMKNANEEEVTSMFFHHSLGDCSYTGTVDANKQPHGKGVATWTSGKAKEYDGQWVHGTMEGEATYTLSNGDVFKGTFTSDKYSKGRYTIKASGEYFEGTFKDGNPQEGIWYDANGNKLE